MNAYLTDHVNKQEQAHFWKQKNLGAEGAGEEGAKCLKEADFRILFLDTSAYQHTHTRFPFYANPFVHFIQQT